MFLDKAQQQKKQQYLRVNWAKKHTFIPSRASEHSPYNAL